MGYHHNEFDSISAVICRTRFVLTRYDKEVFRGYSDQIREYLHREHATCLYAALLHDGFKLVDEKKI